MKEATLSRPFILALSLNKISKVTAKTKTLDEQVYRCVCDYIGANSNGVIVLTGGEPFLDSRLSEILNLKLYFNHRFYLFNKYDSPIFHPQIKNHKKSPLAAARQ
jgi:organic radical activating enzyme